MESGWTRGSCFHLETLLRTSEGHSPQPMLPRSELELLTEAELAPLLKV
jgi:hypothetical protein